MKRLLCDDAADEPRWLRARFVSFAPRLSAALLPLAVAATPGVAVEPDLASLPPPANVRIDFDRDIKPIFQSTCFRCHGPEKPKSHFRLDNRQSALEGGDDNTDDIIPGDSARSFLVQYVAGLVADMQMPPPSQAKPLTPRQVGLLRAWIDQGAHWSATNTGPQLAFTVEPSFRWIGVSGNASKFREIEGVRDGSSSGIGQFSLTEQINPREKFSAEGRFLPQDRDFQLKLALDRADLGFVRVGFEQWRDYSSDAGGYDPAVTPPAYTLNRELHVDHGRAWIDLGLTLPRWPQIVLGYEYQYQNGNEATLNWGFANGKNIYPAWKTLDEQTHIIKLDVTRDLDDWHLAERARVEFYRQANLDNEPNIYNGGATADTFIRSEDNYHHVQGMNTLSVEKQLRDWWRVSGGYYYSRLEGASTFNQTTTDAANVPTTGNFWSSNPVTLRRESHVFSLASLFTPLDCLSLSLGTQNEWTREEGFGDTELDMGDPNNPGLFFLFPATVQSDLDEFKATQNASLRFTKIPCTVLFADGRLDEDRIGLFEQEAGNVPEAFLRETDYRNGRYDVRTGFSTSPWRWFELDAQYRHLLSDSDYNHLRDISVAGEGYPAFILGRKINTDQADIKLTLHPATWLKTTLTYRIVGTDFDTRTDPVSGGISPGGWIFAGNYDTHTYGLGVALTPTPRFVFSGTFTCGGSRMVTADNGTPAVVPYKGDLYSVLANAAYALNPSTDLSVTYSFSAASYGQDNFVSGVPLGLTYARHTVMAGVTRRISSLVSTNLRYAFYRYSEPGSGGINDYTAHGVFATVAIKWP